MNNMERYHDGAPFNGYQILRRKYFYQPLTTNIVEPEMKSFKQEGETDSQISENRIYSRLPDGTELEYEDGKQLDQAGFEGNFNRESGFDDNPSYVANKDESKMYPNYDMGRSSLPFIPDNAAERGESYGESSSIEIVPTNDYYIQDDNSGTVANENNENDQEGFQDNGLFIRKHHAPYRPYFRRLQQFNDIPPDNGNQLSLSSNKPNPEISSEKNPSDSLKKKDLLILLNADEPSDSKSVDGINSMLLEDKLHLRFLVPAYTIKTPESKGSGNKKILIVINEDLLRNGNPSPLDETRKITPDEDVYDKQSPPMENDEGVYQGPVEKNQTLDHMNSLFDNAIDLLAALQLQRLATVSQQQATDTQQQTSDFQQPIADFPTGTSVGGNRNVNDNQNLMDLLEQLYFSHNRLIPDKKSVLEEEKNTAPEVFNHAYESDDIQIKNDPEVLKNLLTLFKGLQEVNSKRLSKAMPKTNANFVGGFSRSNVLLNLPYTISDTSRRFFQQPQETKTFKQSNSRTNEKESLAIPTLKFTVAPDDTEYEYDTKLKVSEDQKKQLIFTNNIKQNYNPSSKTTSLSSSPSEEMTLEDERPKTLQSDRAPTFSTRAEPKNWKHKNPEEPQSRHALTKEKTKDILQRSDSPEDMKNIMVLLNNLLRKSVDGQHSFTEPLSEPIYEAGKMKDSQDIDRSAIEKSKFSSQVTEKPQPSKVGLVSGKEDLKLNNMKPTISRRLKFKVKSGLENIAKGSRALFYDSNPLLSGFHVVPMEDKDISPQNSYPQPTPLYKNYLKYVFSTDNEVGEDPSKVYNPANTAVIFNPDTDTNDQYFTKSGSHYPATYFIKQNLPMVRGLSFQPPWSIIPSIQPIPISALDRSDTAMIYPMTSSITYPALNYPEISGDGNQLLNPTSEEIDLNPLYDVVVRMCKTLKNVVI